MSDYQSNFFIVPTHIRKLPGMTLAFLDFYETIFQFWHCGKECFLSNQMIKDRTGIKSDSTIAEAFIFFEKAGALKREMRGKRRFIVKTVFVERPEDQTPDDPSSVDNSDNNGSKTDHGLANARTTSRPSGNQPLATARHNNNNINIKNINKSFTPSNDKATAQKQYSQPKSPYAPIGSQSTAYGNKSETKEENIRRYEENMRRYAQ